MSDFFLNEGISDNLRNELGFYFRRIYGKTSLINHQKLEFIFL